MPTSPDLTRRKPTRAFRAEGSVLFFLRDVPSLGGHMSYPFVLAAVDPRTRRPKYFLALERSPAGAFICGFSADGAHHNFGLLQEAKSEKAFIDKALSLLRSELRL